MEQNEIDTKLLCCDTNTKYDIMKDLMSDLKNEIKKEEPIR